MAGLFDSGMIGKTKIKNRLIMPPVATSYSDNGYVTEDLVNYYKKIAEGGVGAVIVEAAHPWQGIAYGSGALGIWDDSMVEGLSKLAGAIKSAGAAAFLQLGHNGPQAMDNKVSPSGIPYVRDTTPKELSIEEIIDIENGFAAAAERAKKAGFDGVELHGAHFYLLSCFMSPLMNKRTDAYGQNSEGRTRIVCETIAKIKERCGADYTVSVRVNAREGMEGGIDRDELKEIVGHLEKAHVDVIDLSSNDIPFPAQLKRCTVSTVSIPRADAPQGVFTEYAAEVMEYASVPVITVGKITDKSFAEELISSGKADFIAMARPLIADPNLPNKFLSGEAINSCIYCNACIGAVARNKRMVCTVNPEIK